MEFQRSVSSLDHRSRSPHLTHFFCSLNLVLPLTVVYLLPGCWGTVLCCFHTETAVLHPYSSGCRTDLYFPTGPTAITTGCSSWCPKMSSEYLEENFNDRVVNSVNVFFRTRAWSKDRNKHNKENILYFRYFTLSYYITHQWLLLLLLFSLSTWYCCQAECNHTHIFQHLCHRLDSSRFHSA